MKILNLHGFLGEADNKNYKALCTFYAQDDILSPQLDYKRSAPRDILDTLSIQVDSNDFIFVGQSLGGWYADQLSRKFHRPCILTNPCYYPHKLELIAESGIPAEFLEQYYERSGYEMNPMAYTLCSDADAVLPDNHTNCAKLSHTILYVHGSHSTIENLTAELQKAISMIR